MRPYHHLEPVAHPGPEGAGRREGAQAALPNGQPPSLRQLCQVKHLSTEIVQTKVNNEDGFLVCDYCRSFSTVFTI